MPRPEREQDAGQNRRGEPQDLPQVRAHRDRDGELEQRITAQERHPGSVDFSLPDLIQRRTVF